MSTSTKCVISTSPGVQLQWSTADDGSILLTIRKPRTLNVETGCSWKSEYHNGKLVFRSKCPPQNGEKGDIQCVKEKIEKKWFKRIQHVAEHAGKWSCNPTASFFGMDSFPSSEEWSYRSLSDSDEKADKDRNTLHRLNLAECFRRRKERDRVSDADVKRDMLAAVEPELSSSATREEQGTLYSPGWRRLDRYINQGQTLQSMWRRSPGLVIIVGPMMSRDDLEIVSREGFDGRELGWLSTEQLDEAIKYDSLARTVRASMPRSSGRQLEEHGQGHPSPKRHRSSIYTANMLPISSNNSANTIPADARHVLLLFHALGGSNIPSCLLQRGQCPQSRWSDNGCEYKLVLSEVDLNQQLLEIFMDSNRVSVAMKQLELFLEESQIEGAPVYSLKNPWPHTLSTGLTENEKAEWSLRAARLVSFVFPREQIWESNYGSVRRRLRHLLIHAVNNLTQAGVSSAERFEIAEALLAASKLGGIANRNEAVRLARTILSSHMPADLHIDMTVQESVLLRLSGDYKRSEQVIHDFCRLAKQLETDESVVRQFYRSLETSGKLHALYGRLHVSHLENLVQSEKYTNAIDEIDDWTPSSAASLMELNILPRKSIVVSKIFRSQGQFERACQELDRCLTVMRPHDNNRYQVLCNLADAYCDLGSPDKALEVLSREVETVKHTPRKGKPFRRLLVSTVEAQIQQRHYESVQHVIRELEFIFSGLATVDVSDELLHMRVLLGSARLCHSISDSSGALERWNTALLHLRRYRSFEDQGYIYAVIQLSISLSHLQLGNIAEAGKAFDFAASVLGTGIKDFWIPGLVEWRQSVEQSIRSRIQWTIEYVGHGGGIETMTHIKL